MVNQFLEIISALSSFSPRQGENEIQSAMYLEGLLSKITPQLQVQKYSTRVPLVSNAYLTLDGQEIACLGCSFTTGNITSKSQIKFNPSSDYISTPSFYQKPSVAISRLDSNKLDKANIVDGRVTIERYSYTSRNFLVGNLTNPQNIIFTHYDSLWGGAIDNAGGVAVCLKLLSLDQLRSDNLFVIAGNEELSYDFPNYWGYGYRQFEKFYLPLLRQAKQILVVDGVGLTSAEVITDDLDNFLPLKYLSHFENKIKAISSNQTEVLKCYHCQEDVADKLNTKHLEESVAFLEKLLIL